MWEQKDYSFEGNGWSVPGPHNILPNHMAKDIPYLGACGNPETLRKPVPSIGAIASTLNQSTTLKGRLEAYKEAAAYLPKSSDNS